MDDLDPFVFQARLPTPSRPLLGLTVLVVEDSRFASEALRLMCLRSGARIRRADCLNSARRHLKVYRPSIAVIDIGLKDGSGADLIAEMAAVDQRASILIGMSGDPNTEPAARAAGADGFLVKPVTSLAQFQELILSLLPPDRRPTGPRPTNDEQIEPDPIAYQDDLAHMADVLDATAVDGDTMDYVAQFLGSVATSAHDEVMLQAVCALQTTRAKGQSTQGAVEKLTGLVHKRLEHKIAM